MRYRYERKYILDAQTARILKSRIGSVLHPDKHSGGQYVVHNIYFDDMFFTAYQAKLVGAFIRDKYRIRYYNNDLSYIRLEHKHKKGDLSAKQSVPISREEFAELRTGELPLSFDEKEPVGPVFSRLYRVRRLRPVVEFTYYREAYTHPAGNTRVTFDSNIPGGYGVMELKYSHFLPCFIAELLTGVPLMQAEMSKYGTVMDKKRSRLF